MKYNFLKGRLFKSFWGWRLGAGPRVNSQTEPWTVSGFWNIPRGMSERCVCLNWFPRVMKRSWNEQGLKRWDWGEESVGLYSSGWSLDRHSWIQFHSRRFQPELWDFYNKGFYRASLSVFVFRNLIYISNKFFKNKFWVQPDKFCQESEKRRKWRSTRKTCSTLLSCMKHSAPFNLLLSLSTHSLQAMW